MNAVREAAPARLGMHPVGAVAGLNWIDRFRLRDGTVVTVRPVRPQDDQPERDFVARGLSQRSRYLRFQVSLRELPDALAHALTHVDFHHHVALVAEAWHGGCLTQVADVRFVRVAGAPHRAEFALAVADAWQGLGIGARLLETITQTARAQGVVELFGDVLRDNRGMLALAEAQGFTRRRHPDDATLVRVRRSLRAGAPLNWAGCERMPWPTHPISSTP